MVDFWWKSWQHRIGWQKKLLQKRHKRLGTEWDARGRQITKVAVMRNLAAGIGIGWKQDICIKQKQTWDMHGYVVPIRKERQGNWFRNPNGEWVNDAYCFQVASPLYAQDVCELSSNAFSGHHGLISWSEAEPGPGHKWTWIVHVFRQRPFMEHALRRTVGVHAPVCVGGSSWNGLARLLGW